jgi:hypothetical protein
MNYIVCIGGTGTRCFEAANYLAAANLLNSDSYKVITIDKDNENGGTAKAKTSVDGYIRMRNEFANSSMNFEQQFCKPIIERETWDFDAVLNEIKDISSKDRTLAKTLMSNNANDKVLLNLIFSEEEQNLELDKGFCGHPSIGAMLFKYVTQDCFINNPKNEVLKRIENVFTAGHEKINVFIIGSIFGGTGAAIFPNIAKYFRDKAAASKTPSNIRIGGVLMLPYFSVPNTEEQSETAKITNIKTNEFIMKSKIALEQYHEWKVIGDDNSIFDSLYLLGHRPYYCTAESNENGGSNQKNHFHLVDYYAGDALCHFFNDYQSKGIFVAQLNDKEMKGKTSFENLPNSNETKIKLIQMEIFSSYVVLCLMPQFEILKRDDLKIKKIPALCQTYGHNLNGISNADANEIVAFTSLLNSIYKYCVAYLNFIFEISLTGRDWHDKSDSNVNCELFGTFDLSRILSMCEKLDDKNNNNFSFKDFDDLHSLSELTKGRSKKDFVSEINNKMECDTKLYDRKNASLYFNKLYDYCSMK